MAGRCSTGSDFDADPPASSPTRAGPRGAGVDGESGSTVAHRPRPGNRCPSADSAAVVCARSADAGSNTNATDTATVLRPLDAGSGRDPGARSARRGG